MGKTRTPQEAIEYLQNKPTAGDMSVDEAISLIGSRDGRPREDDWDLLEAAEVIVRAYDDLKTSVELAEDGFP
jgi:hypothetical protein